MSNTPASNSDTTADEDDLEVRFGQAVFDADGTRLGSIRGFDRSGFFVATRDGVETAADHARGTQGTGEAELMWRCLECGEMGDLDEGLPETCPDCGTEKENLMYWTED